MIGELKISNWPLPQTRPVRLPIHTYRLWIVGIVFLFTQGGAAAHEGALRVGGYVKGFISVLDPSSYAGGGSMRGVALIPLRLKVFWKTNERVSGEFAYELTPQVRRGEALFSAALPRPEPFSYRGVDLPGSFAFAQNLDRAFFTVSVPAADFYLGRQAIAFGSARVVNPTDVIAPFTYETLDKEEWAGVDALRARLPVGEMGEVDAGVVFGRNFSVRAGAAFLRGRFYLMETYFSPMALVFRENLLLGIDLARSMGGAGSWLEAAFVRANRSGEDYFRVSCGLDYRFSNGIYGFFEYHFNGAGASQVGAYLQLLGETAFTEGGVYLMGRHYAAPGFTYQATPLLTLSVQTLVNLGDGSAFFAPQAEYSFTEDVFAAAGAFYGLGRRARVRTEGIEPRSEFRLYPAIYFASLRVYI